MKRKSCRCNYIREVDHRVRRIIHLGLSLLGSFSPEPLEHQLHSGRHSRSQSRIMSAPIVRRAQNEFTFYYQTQIDNLYRAQLWYSVHGLGSRSYVETRLQIGPIL